MVDHDKIYSAKGTIFKNGSDDKRPYVQFEKAVNGVSRVQIPETLSHLVKDGQLTEARFFADGRFNALRSPRDL